MYNKNISFIIPAYNCHKTINESIESIFNGNITDQDEVIIINDSSTDTTLQAISDLQKKYSQISIISHQINKGSAAASRNTGIDHSKNELIFCLDSDNILTPGSIPQLRDYMKENKAECAAFGELHYFKDSKEGSTHTWNFKKEVTLGDALTGMHWPGPSGNYLFTKESWIRAQRYNESIGGAYDSWAFGIQQLATGSRMVTLPHSYYLHRFGYESTFIKDEKKYKPSLIGLATLLPFLDLIEDEDVEYIMNHEHRYTWIENLEKRPLRLKKIPLGLDGTMTKYKPGTTSYISKVKKFIGHTCPFLSKYKHVITKYVQKIISTHDKKDLQSERVKPWEAIQGDKTLRLNYNLDTSSIVIDVGGYEGQWASDIFSKYSCTIVIFEPVQEFYKKIKERFLKNEKISVYDVGLSNTSKKVEISLLDNSSSVFKNHATHEIIQLVDTSQFLKEKKLTDIALLKINIEGSEYDLLDNIIASGLIGKIKNIQVQFHDFVPDAHNRMHGIQEILRKTHHITYQYEFVWENWERNEK